MNTELPAREDYYRLTRARALREKADRLDWSRGSVGALCAFFVPIVFLGCSFAAGILETGLWNYPGRGVALPFVMGLIFVPVGFGIYRMETMITSLRSEADALEAEHPARYGALPEAQALPVRQYTLERKG
jgi:hypothetical protein